MIWSVPRMSLQIWAELGAPVGSFKGCKKRNGSGISQPASPEPDAPPKKTRGPGAVSAALAAAAPAAAPPPPSPSPPPLPTEPLPFYRTVEHDGARWMWGHTAASPRVKSSTVGYWRRCPGGTAP